MLLARRMEPVRHIAWSVNVPRLLTLRTFLYRSKRHNAENANIGSDVMASSTLTFGESINNICS